jgi:putative addiction module killer protein
MKVLEVLQTEQYARWFSKLKDRTAKARIDIRIRRVSLGNFGDVESVGEGVSELRIPYGPGYRVYFTQGDESLIVLLIGGDKSSQRKDVARAKDIARIIKR